MSRLLCGCWRLPKTAPKEQNPGSLAAPALDAARIHTNRNSTQNQTSRTSTSPKAPISQSPDPPTLTVGTSIPPTPPPSGFRVPRLVRDPTYTPIVLGPESAQPESVPPIATQPPAQGDVIPASTPPSVKIPDIQPSPPDQPYHARLHAQAHKFAKEKLDEKDWPFLEPLTGDWKMGDLVKDLNTAHEHWRSNKNDAVAKRMGKILGAVDKYAAIVSIGIQHSPEITSLVWAGVSTMLQVQSLHHSSWIYSYSWSIMLTWVSQHRLLAITSRLLNALKRHWQ